MPSWRLINELFFKSFISRLCNEPSATTGCFSPCTPILLGTAAVRHKCERSLAPARETTISWVQLPSGYVSRDLAVPCYSVTPARQMVVQVNNLVAGAPSVMSDERLVRHLASQNRLPLSWFAAIASRHVKPNQWQINGVNSLLCVLQYGRPAEWKTARRRGWVLAIHYRVIQQMWQA